MKTLLPLLFLLSLECGCGNKSDNKNTIIDSPITSKPNEAIKIVVTRTLVSASSGNYYPYGSVFFKMGTSEPGYQIQIVDNGNVFYRTYCIEGQVEGRIAELKKSIEHLNRVKHDLKDTTITIYP